MRKHCSSDLCIIVCMYCIVCIITNKKDVKNKLHEIVEVTEVMIRINKEGEIREME